MDFRVYSNRWGHEDTYKVIKTDSGWHVSHNAINGDCDKSGAPVLYANFAQDHISYPSTIGEAMEHLWDQIDVGGIGVYRAQEMLQDLADWVSACEKAEPSWPGWN